jgi:hypothetical protein
VFVASLVDAIGALREIMIPSAQVSRASIRREGFLFGLGVWFGQRLGVRKRRQAR